MSKLGIVKCLLGLCYLLPNLGMTQQIDLGKAEFQSDGADAVVVTGFQLQTGRPEDANDRFKARFRWAADKQALFMEPTSLQKMGAIGSGNCRMAQMVSSGDRLFVAQTNPVSTGEFGGIVNIFPNDQGLSISWFKGSLGSNPFLVKRNITNLKENGAYGILGEVAKSYPGLWAGQLIEVTGSVDKGGFQIRGIESGAVINFSSKDKTFWKGTGCSLASNKYSSYSSSDYFEANVIDQNTGGVQTVFPSSRKFDAAWNSAWKQNPAVSLGGVGQTTLGGGIVQGDRIFVTPLGFGFSITAIGSDGGPKTTMVFTTRK